MKTLLFVIIALGFSFTTQANAQCKLTTVVSGIEETKGTVYIALFDSSSFLKKRIAGKKIVADKNGVQVDFTNVPSGEYAIAIYQDENDNEELDRGMFGIPSEKYGFSNNAKPTMGPPRFEACKFELKQDTIIHITLQ